MSRLSRLLLRLRQRFLRCYEIAMFGMLVALAVAAAVPGGATGAAPAQCGNIQSSTVVMQK